MKRNCLYQDVRKIDCKESRLNSLNICWTTIWQRFKFLSYRHEKEIHYVQCQINSVGGPRLCMLKLLSRERTHRALLKIEVTGKGFGNCCRNDGELLPESPTHLPSEPVAAACALGNYELEGGCCFKITILHKKTTWGIPAVWLTS